MRNGLSIIRLLGLAVLLAASLAASPQEPATPPAAATSSVERPRASGPVAWAIEWLRRWRASLQAPADGEDDNPRRVSPFVSSVLQPEPVAEPPRKNEV